MNIKTRLERIEKIVGTPGEPSAQELQDAHQARLAVAYAKLNGVALPMLTARQEYVLEWSDRRWPAGPDAKTRLNDLIERQSHTAPSAPGKG